MTDHLADARRKLYIAGPMTSIDDYNFPAFNAAEAELRAAGYDVANPASIGVHEGWGWGDYMRPALKLMLDCDGVALLPGWEGSRGARIEFVLALGLTMHVDELAVWLAGGEDRTPERQAELAQLLDVPAVTTVGDLTAGHIGRLIDDGNPAYVVRLGSVGHSSTGTRYTGRVIWRDNGKDAGTVRRERANPNTPCEVLDRNAGREG